MKRLFYSIFISATLSSPVWSAPFLTCGVFGLLEDRASYYASIDLESAFTTYPNRWSRALKLRNIDYGVVAYRQVPLGAGSMFIEIIGDYDHCVGEEDSWDYQCQLLEDNFEIILSISSPTGHTETRLSKSVLLFMRTIEQPMILNVINRIGFSGNFEAATQCYYDESAPFIPENFNPAQEAVAPEEVFDDLSSEPELAPSNDEDQGAEPSQVQDS